MTEHAEALEADLLRHYGVDVLDYHRGRVSSRRMRVLIAHLPRDSALAREVHGEGADWGLAEHLLALTADHLAVGNWLFTSAHAGRGRTPPKPSPVPRPGSATPARGPRGSPAPEADAARLREFFGPPNPAPSPRPEHDPTPAERAT